MEGKKRLYRRGKKSPGQRSVEAIINTAAKTRSRAKVRYTKPNGEMLEAEIAPAEAVEIRETANALAEPKTLSAPQRAIAERAVVQVAVDKLRQAGSENLSQSQIQAVVEIIVAALEAAGASHVLPEIASQLEMHGLFDFAAAVRQHIRGSGGSLTTT